MRTEYEKIKKITIWIPFVGILLMLIFEKELNSKPMYEEYFEWGNESLVLISAFWQGLSTLYIVIKCWYLFI